MSQLKEEVRGYTEQSAAKVKEIEFIGRELEGVRDLFSKNLIPISRVTALERDAARLEGERGQLVATIAQGKGKISETELQIIQVDQTMRSDVAKELADIRAKISELTERRVTAADQLQRIDIRAPQTGIVHQLSFFTTGGVVAAGEQIMLIVPQADDLTVEVRVDPQKIDQLQLGQAATLRFPGFNQRTTPELNGRVTRIAADVIRCRDPPLSPSATRAPSAASRGAPPAPPQFHLSDALGPERRPKFARRNFNTALSVVSQCAPIRHTVCLL